MTHANGAPARRQTARVPRRGAANAAGRIVPATSQRHGRWRGDMPWRGETGEWDPRARTVLARGRPWRGCPYLPHQAGEV